MNPPCGVEERRPTGGAQREWVIRPDPAGGYLQLRLYAGDPGDPLRRRPPRPGWVEVYTGPASFGVALSDPDAVRRTGWQALAALHALAAELEAGPQPEPAPEPPDPQTTLFDQLEAAGIAFRAPTTRQEARP